jgi:hypothetical protein
MLSPEHPTERPALPAFLLFAFVGGCGFAYFEMANPGFSFLGVVAVLLFAVFVVAFGVFWLAWLLREHQRWIDGSPGTQSEGTAGT